ncbi:kinase-like protein [Tuber magnatum]|uniref:Kinase-like protein n=1 Tax=Tuber magnatum TaxID=42249 RepID=A0A317SFA3_9PEZI|nr:kinase-like protein [Tuber magnatum]
MERSQSDLLGSYKLETEFFQDRVSHTGSVGRAEDRDKKAKEDWKNCGELGKGGFGVVHKQIQETTSHCRAVKKIDKGLAELDYSRELLVMAILTKRPELFVEFLGWFEEPKALYIAMEYLEKGDLTKHIGVPLPQETVRDIWKQILEGLENIFVVSMSPVWVKLGDFGISKRARAQDSTTFHTQVSTPLYGAPEVLGLDSNSETSVYTNSVDIWSLGCVIYELLVGERLFDSDGQVLRYYLGGWRFPKDKLKGLSPPMDDSGILLLESMLAIQPEDRPTAAGALSHAWLMGAKSGSGGGGGGGAETVRGRGGDTWGGAELANDSKPEKRRSEVSPITRGEIKYTPGDVTLEMNPGSQRGSGPIAPKPAIDTSVTTPQDAASAEGPPTRAGPPSFELAPHNFPATHPKGAEELGREQIRSIPQTCPEGDTSEYWTQPIYEASC